MKPTGTESRIPTRCSVRTHPASAAEVLQRLGDASGFLRHQVAAAITRKRAPEIFFALVASGEVMP